MANVFLIVLRPIFCSVCCAALVSLDISTIIHLRTAASDASVHSSGVRSHFVARKLYFLILYPEPQSHAPCCRYSNSITRFGVRLLSSLLGLQNTALVFVSPVHLKNDCGKF
ncbi:hypothetical protein BDR03DRAFT_694259 [Suillus americanus]|nr:hypothetical protein BDR03DRAFT_694259 [Suillus americanus]